VADSLAGARDQGGVPGGVGGRHKLFSLDAIASKLAPSPLLFGANRCGEFVQIMDAHKAIGANTPLDLTQISLGAEHPCCVWR
jgi:hypothetical protein